MLGISGFSAGCLPAARRRGSRAEEMFVMLSAPLALCAKAAFNSKEVNASRASFGSLGSRLNLSRVFCISRVAYKLDYVR